MAARQYNRLTAQLNWYILDT